MSLVDFGRDISATTSIRTGRFATYAQLIGEACFRRLTTPRGMLRGGEEEQNYGLDLTELVGETNPDTVASSLPGRIKSELRKDERVLTVTVTVAATKSGPSTSFAITIDVTTDVGPFTLQLLADGVTTELLGITT